MLIFEFHAYLKNQIFVKMFVLVQSFTEKSRCDFPQRNIIFGSLYIKKSMDMED